MVTAGGSRIEPSKSFLSTSRAKGIRVRIYPSPLRAIISKLLGACVLVLLVVTDVPMFRAQSREGQPGQIPQTGSSLEFVHHFVEANGVRLHYVVVGHGEPVLLLPGWPESWYAWRSVMAILAASGRQVYALDPRGYGDSEKPASGYDLATSAEDIHAFIVATGLTRPGGIDIVGHDLGTWIAYAHADAHPEDVHRLVVSEAALPALDSTSNIPDDSTNIKTWHFAFNRLDDLPEILVQGHERAYLTWLFSNKSFRTWQIDPVSLDEYLRVFLIPGTARADFAYYREAFSRTGLDQMKLRTGHKLAMPVLAIGGEGGVGLGMLHTMQRVGENVRGRELLGCGHYLPDECPNEFTTAILDFWREENSASDSR
jgi:pimeloyl-ACP methyl ester carboxylesterase